MTLGYSEEFQQQRIGNSGVYVYCVFAINSNMPPDLTIHLLE